MFSSQINKKRAQNIEPAISFLLTPSMLKSLQKTSVDKKHTKIELQTWTIKKLDELLCHKTEQMIKFGYVLAHKSIYYHHHQML